MGVLPRRFYARDVVEVARELLGMHLCRGSVRLRITETEAYRWPGDTACHARAGRTARNAPLWGPPGHVYVYLCYGLHNLLNIVTGEDGEAAAVLIRSCEVLSGERVVGRRRGGQRGPTAVSGPGNVGQALGLDRRWCDHPVYRSGGLTIARGRAPAGIVAGPRVGIDYAEPEHRALPWRFGMAESPSITRRHLLARL